MKKIYESMIGILACMCAIFASCDNYLNIEPKGKRIPKDLADYEAMLRYEYGMHRMNVTQTCYLLNDLYLTNSYAGYYPLYKANYNWEQETDRIYWNSSDEATYYNGYGAIGTANLIIENAMSATNATDAERREVYAYARVLRAMNYFNLANYYADTYEGATASSKKSVPFITSSEVGAAYKQVSIQEIYDYILKDLKETLTDLPDMGTTALHPGKGAALAMLARTYLQMADYDNALNYANQALTVNSELYDWTAYYEKNKSQIENPGSYTATASPLGFDCIENYSFNHGSGYSASRGMNMPVWRISRFEQDDAYFLASWKLRTVGSETYYYSTTTGYFNYGGMRTVEQYLIKAECLVRKNRIDDAMDELNKVRKKRILPEFYQARTATTQAKAIEYIRQTKDNELMYSIVPFADNRRYNAEGTYAHTFTKEANGAAVTLPPSSHLWTMPFPQGAIDNPGNGTITQNTSK